MSFITDSNVHRPAKSFYFGKNGFFRGPTEPHEIPSLPLARDEHQRALFILQHKKRPAPDFEDMKAEVERTDDSFALKERIQQLRTEHEKDLEFLYDVHANDYLTEVMDRYASKSDFPSGDIEGVNALEKLSGPFKDMKTQHDWANDLETLRYTYLATLLPLKKQQKELEEREVEMTRRRAQMFPQSVEDFKTKPNEVKLRAARFLVADPARQERLLNEYQWAWRQVKPLQEIFAKDDLFRSEILSMIIAADIQVRDPRKRTSL